MPKIIGYADWEGIKADYCAGDLTGDEIAQKWRVSKKTISSRASRQGWPTPARIRETMDKAVAMASEVVMQGLERSGVPGSPEEIAMRSLGVIQQAGSDPTTVLNAPAKVSDALSYQQAMAEFAMHKVTAGFGRMKPPANWRELATADTIARRALGLDSKNGASAAAMVRITRSDGSTMDVAAGASVDVDASVEEDGDDWGE
jgi:hypothetical protein